MSIEACLRRLVHSLSYIFAWLPSAVEKPSLLPAKFHSVLMKRGLFSLHSFDARLLEATVEPAFGRSTDAEDGCQFPYILAHAVAISVQTALCFRALERIGMKQSVRHARIHIFLRNLSKPLEARKSVNHRHAIRRPQPAQSWRAPWL